MLFSVFSFLILLSSIHAFVDYSPICSMDSTRIQGGMGGSQTDFKVELASEQKSYKSGDVITLTLNVENEYNGILLYAAPASDPTKRVGSFIVPTGFQNNKARCDRDGFQSDNDNSVLTHTADQTYSKSQTFTFTAPANASSDLQFSIIVVRKNGNNYDYFVGENIVTIAFDKGNDQELLNDIVVCSSNGTTCPPVTVLGNCEVRLNSTRIGVYKYEETQWQNDPQSSIQNQATVRLNPDGNLVVFDSQGNETWRSNSLHISDVERYDLILTTDCRLKIMTENKLTIWPAACTEECSSELVDPFSSTRLVTQEDGNLVLYDGQNNVRWASDTNGKGQGPYKLIMQSDGNLVLYGKDSFVVWASNTNKEGRGPCTLTIEPYFEFRCKDGATAKFMSRLDH